MNPWFIVGALISAGGMFVFGDYLGHARGVTTERSIWQAREIKQANAYAKALQDAQDERAAAERAFVVSAAGIAQKHAQEIEDERLQKDRDVAAARAGRIVLRIPIACTAPGDGAPAAPGPAPGDGHGAATAELPRETAADLLGLADDADAVVRQLTACQAQIRADRSCVIGTCGF